MTYQGAIDEVKMLSQRPMMPDIFKPSLNKIAETLEMTENAPAGENVNGNEYWVVTREGSFYIVANYLDIDYDEKQQCDYVQAFDQDGQVIAYFKDVEFWLLIDGKQKMLYKATNQE